MKPVTAVVLGTIVAFAFSAEYDSHRVLARQSSGRGQGAEKLPADVHPDTLSRMPRPKRDDFTTDEEKQAFDRVMTLVPKLKVSRWLGGHGTRLEIPELAEVYLKQINMLHEKGGLEPKYQQLAILVAVREANDESAFLEHESQAIKLHISPEAVKVVRNRQDTKGLDEKEAVIIQFGRELFQQPKVSSGTFAAAERNFGRKGTLGMTLYMGYYTANAMLMHVYDQRMDASADCVEGNGCDTSDGRPW